MISRTRLTFVAAAALALGSMSYAQQEQQPAAGAAAPAPAQPAQPYQAQPRPAAAGGATADQQQMMQQLQQIAQDPNTAADKLFLLFANHESLKCQQLSQQVATKAQNKEVQQLAQRLVQDEQQTLQRLQTVAQSLQVQLPRSLSAKDQQIIQIMASLPADQLEKHYAAGVHAGSTAAILQLQSCAQLSQNDAMKRFAQETLPVIQQQHQQAMTVAQALGIQTRTEAITAGAKIGADSTATPPSRSDSPAPGVSR